ncbi:MAG: hypothetical protein U5J78_06560 [Parasphingorhabdus sp.]|nr:hypothetical protein [Parasphingorhabdus sp.]
MKAISAQFMERKDGFDVVVDGRAVIVHRVDAPAFTLARGNPDVAMYRGNFRIDDSPKGMIAPTQIVSISTEAVCLSHDGNPILRLTIIPEYDGFTLCIASQQAEFDRLSITLPATAEERIWGGGEQMSYLNLRGRKFPMWTSEPGVGRDKSTALTQLMDEEGMAGGDYWTTNYPQPTFLSSQNYACHLTSTAYSELDFTDPGHHRISVCKNTAELRFFFGEDLLSLVRQVSDYFGRPPPLPDWAIGGAIVGLKDGANSFDRLNHIRAAGASVSALWCEDWVGVRQTSFGRRLFWDWQWNMERYPNLSQHIAQLADDGIRSLWAM